MQTHYSGAITGTRQGSNVVAQSYRFTQANTEASTNTHVKLITIQASPTKPAALRLRAVLTEVFNDVGAVTLSAGIVQGGATLLSLVDLKGALGVNYVPANNVVVFEADTPIWIMCSHAGAKGAAGKVDVTAEIWELNLNNPSLDT